MNTLQFLLTFLVLTVISSGAIVGWFLSTRGSWEITPDGKWKKTGMIFKYWSLFFEQYRKTKKIYYIGKSLADKYALVSKIRPDLIPGKYCIGLLEIEGYFRAPLDKYQIEEKDLNALKDLLLVEIEWDTEGKGFRFYKDEPIYDWPQWVQKPLSSCPGCMASPYGTAIWLVFLKLQRDAFAWADSPVLAKICFYIVFLLTLSYLNTFLKQKIKI
jgi:hypothetical protein